MKRERSFPTMKDVAQQAGVSLGTVSKVINGLPVGDEYRKKVEAATRKLGYQVNNYARGLKTNKTNSVAVIVPTLQHPFFAWLVDEITAALMHQQYRPILMTTNYDNGAEQKCISLVQSNKIDGVIALTYSPDLAVDASLPFVTIDRRLNADTPCVSSDNYSGGQLAARKLIDLGCRNLLFFRTGSEVSSEVDKRGVGFESACRIADTDCRSIILNDRETLQPFFQYIHDHLYTGKPDFDGIFCSTDHLACQIICYLRSLSVRVPEDVQIIGFDGIENFATGKPYCSTIVQPVRQMAEAAVNVLLNEDLTAMPALLSLPVSYRAGGTTRE